MCGIAGFTGRCKAPMEIVGRMVDALGHRGPDARGAWLDEEAGVALGHSRLAIQDLADTGLQPMHGGDGRYVIVFNGEIYNHLELRKRIERRSGGWHWRGTSDTETLLACIEIWGVDETLALSLGMFAFALYDRENRLLTLARDRFGEKPLYYQPLASGILFGSELSALLPHEAASRELEPEALRQLLSTACIAAPWSIRRGVFKLLAGTVLEVDQEGVLSTRRWWSAVASMQAGIAAPVQGSDTSVLDELESVLVAAVERQMIADVPLGAFLSGGIDSSLIVALMRQSRAGDIRTFSIGFDDPRFDESTHARAVASHLGTRHTEFVLGAVDVERCVTRLPAMFSEPFADASQIPTRAVAEMARGHVTVALSGDGGDELFGGYNRHVFAAGGWIRLRRVPVLLRRGAGAALQQLPEGLLERAASALPGLGRLTRAGEIIKRSAHISGAVDGEDLYARSVSVWPDHESVLGERFRLAEKGQPGPQAELLLHQKAVEVACSTLDLVMLLDQLHYLPEDILAKVDRASMSVSLESRIPFLDPHVAAFAWRLPERFRVRDGVNKWALRELLYRHVPRSLVERPKMGFSLPLDALLRGPLRDWADAMLASERLDASGWLDTARVRTLWCEHLAGANRMQMLWPVLMFESWREHWDRDALAAG